MKITKSIFGKEDNDIEKFNELDLDERSSKSNSLNFSISLSSLPKIDLVIFIFQSSFLFVGLNLVFFSFLHNHYSFC